MNPVHYDDSSTEWERDTATYNGPGWYFWDETFVARNGPYATEAEANAECERYCIEVLGHDSYNPTSRT